MRKDHKKSLKEFIEAELKKVRSHYKEKETIQFKPIKLKKTTIITDVKSIKMALSRILHSMVENTHGTEVEVSVDFAAEASTDGYRPYEIVVKDNSSFNYDFGPTREFIHGKLLKYKFPNSGIFLLRFL